MIKAKTDKEAAFWNKFAKYYDDFMRRTYQNQYKDMLKMMADKLDNNKTVLEIGTGTGNIAISIASNAKEIMACDISTQMIKIAEEKARARKIDNIVFSVQDAYSFDFPDNSFDVVVLCNVLHIVRYPEKLLFSIKRVLKQEGVLIAPTYCHGQNIASHIMSRIMSVAGFRAHSRWSVHSLQAFLQDHDYIILKSMLLKSKPPMLYIVCRKACASEDYGLCSNSRPAGA